PVTPADARILHDPFLTAFRLAPDYANYSTALFKKSAADYFQRFFENVGGEWSPVSVVAELGGTPAGAALVKQRRSGPLLDCIFVLPEHGRRGLATMMASEVVAGLLRRGETRLVSYVVLANEPSMAWHQRFGFREVPDVFVASQRARVAQDELERHRLLQDL